MPDLLSRFCISIILVVVFADSDAAETSGRVGVESRVFFDNSQFQNTLLLEPEFYWSWNNGNDSILLQPFVRLDDHDSERSHADIREFRWLHVGDSWELTAGIGKVYWGVTESQHLVDIVNQTDFVESIDQEEKLGQPMAQFSLTGNSGSFDILVLPYFRERNFGGFDARLQGPLRIDNDNPLYESGSKEHHIDYALRYSRYVGDWDFGLSYFSGTSRDPNFLPTIDAATGSILLRQLYPQIDQFGVDIQATLGAWLWKLEAISRDGTGQDYAAMTAGFEYTFNGVFESQADLGLLLEFNRDSRGRSSPAPFQKDLFGGARLALNDAQSFELLFGVSVDLDDSSSYSGLVEASRRFGDSFKVSLDAWFFSSDDPVDANFLLRNDDFASIAVEFYF